MRLLCILGIASLSLFGVSGLSVEGEPDVNAPLVQQHIRDREKMIKLEKTHRQGPFPRYVYLYIHEI